MHNYFFFDELKEKGDKIRLKNKMKTKTLMNCTVSFADKKTLLEMQKVLFSLTPEEMKQFKAYLDNKEFVRPGPNAAVGQRVTSKLVRIAMSGQPVNEELQNIKQKFQANLEEIDQLKVKCSNTAAHKGGEVTKMIQKINTLNSENAELFKKIRSFGMRSTQTT